MMQLLTATGCREVAFELCQIWMKNQTYDGPVHWIVVDDGEEEQPILLERDNWTITQVRPKPFWSSGDNTQRRNLKAGLEYVNDNEPLVIIEDDDYYHPKWLEKISENINKYDLIGETQAHYFNVNTKIHKRCHNKEHSSLCATAMKNGAIQTFRESCELNEKFIDMKLWKNFTGKKLLLNTNYVVGMKGLPGRENIGIGKRLTGNPDPNFNALRRLIGDDCEYYKQICNKN